MNVGWRINYLDEMFVYIYKGFLFRIYKIIFVIEKALKGLKKMGEGFKLVFFWRKCIGS